MKLYLLALLCMNVESIIKITNFGYLHKSYALYKQRNKIINFLLPKMKIMYYNETDWDSGEISWEEMIRTNKTELVFIVNPEDTTFLFVI